jgi:hypothetical protein
VPLNSRERQTPRLWLALTASLAACSSQTGNVPGGGNSGASGGIGQTAGSSSASGNVGPSGAAAATGDSAQTMTGSSAGSASSGIGSASSTGVQSAGANAGAPTADGGTFGPADGSASPGDGGSSSPHFAGTANILVLGSSNELGSCWRAFLWQKLHAAGITNFHYVGGTKAGAACGVPGYETNLEAQGGWVIENISAAQWLTIFKNDQPDIVLEHNGGADLLQGHPYGNVIKAYTLAVQQARMVNPHVIYLAAQHTPQRPDNADVMAMNAAMIPWSAGITTSDSPVQLVDLWTGIDMNTDMGGDGVHLNDMGSQKVADRWFAALQPILKP